MATNNLRNFMDEPIPFMRELAIKGTPIQRVRLGPKIFHFVFCPELAQEILVRRFANYGPNKTIFSRIRPVTGAKGLVQLTGPASKKGRAQSRSLFGWAALDRAAQITKSFTHELLEKIKAPNVIQLDIADEMNSLILKTALKIFLDVDSPPLTEEIRTKFSRLNLLCGRRMRELLPLPLLIPTERNREILHLRSELRHLIAQQQSTEGLWHTFGDQSKEFMIDQCLTFLFAGHETTASSLAFTFLLLANSSQHQEMVAHGNEETRLAVYKEALRLYPPAYMLVREAVHADQLGGTKIQAADQVIIAVESLHRSPGFFSQPTEFRPERFLRELAHPFSFIPFGAGDKSCVGERLAYLEANIVLQIICQRFYLEARSEPIAAIPFITLHPAPKQIIKLRPRLVTDLSGPNVLSLNL